MISKSVWIAATVVLGSLAAWSGVGGRVDQEASASRPGAEIPKPHDNRDLLEGATSGNTGTYGNFTAADVALWERETYGLVLEGARVFRNPAALGSTIGVSCGTCHLDAANTHPETYPKYQVQLGRVALLRDMIDWCSKHSVRGDALSADDPRTRALEAYIVAERQGRPIRYGKH